MVVAVKWWRKMHPDDRKALIVTIVAVVAFLAVPVLLYGAYQLVPRSQHSFQK